MPHIKLPAGIPGIMGGLLYRPEVAGPIAELSEWMLRGPNTLSLAERELIGAYVSTRNECYFCQSSHRAAAAHHLNKDYTLVDAVRCDPENAPVSPKLKALLAIAGKVQESGKSVAAFTPEDDKVYDRIGSMMVNKGYAMPGKIQLWLMGLFMRFKKDRNAARSASAS